MCALFSGSNFYKIAHFVWSYVIYSWKYFIIYKKCYQLCYEKKNMIFLICLNICLLNQIGRLLILLLPTAIYSRWTTLLRRLPRSIGVIRNLPYGNQRSASVTKFIQKDCKIVVLKQNTILYWKLIFDPHGVCYSDF